MPLVRSTKCTSRTSRTVALVASTKNTFEVNTNASSVFQYVVVAVFRWFFSFPARSFAGCWRPPCPVPPSHSFGHCGARSTSDCEPWRTSDRGVSESRGGISLPHCPSEFHPHSTGFRFTSNMIPVCHPPHATSPTAVAEASMGCGALRTRGGSPSCSRRFEPIT